jgi:hypothetical protein
MLTKINLAKVNEPPGLDPTSFAAVTQYCSLMNNKQILCLSSTLTTILQLRGCDSKTEQVVQPKKVPVFTESKIYSSADEKVRKPLERKRLSGKKSYSRKEIANIGKAIDSGKIVKGWTKVNGRVFKKRAPKPKGARALYKRQYANAYSRYRDSFLKSIQEHEHKLNDWVQCRKCTTYHIGMFEARAFKEYCLKLIKNKKPPVKIQDYREIAGTYKVAVSMHCKKYSIKPIETFMKFLRGEINVVCPKYTFPKNGKKKANLPINKVVKNNKK